MTTDPQPSAAPAPTATQVATDAVFRTALRDMLVLLGVTAVLGIGVGVLVAGTPGAWGALIGVGLVLVFSGTTIFSMLRTAHSDPQVTAAVVMGAWLGKIVVVIAVLAVLRGMDFYSRGVLAVVVAVGVIGSALLDFRAVTRGRVPYVEPSATPSDTRPGQTRS